MVFLPFGGGAGGVGQQLRFTCLLQLLAIMALFPPWQALQRWIHFESLQQQQQQKDVEPFIVHLSSISTPSNKNITGTSRDNTTTITTISLKNETNLQQQEDDNDDERVGFFSACLMFMDDNHYLVEWLAYHYHVLPLRRLIVAVDRNSHTTPTPIFDRYRTIPGKHNKMEITEWSDRHFISRRTRLQWNKQQQQRNKNKMNTTNFTNNSRNFNRQINTTDDDIDDTNVNWFRFRQRSFYQHCLRTLHKEGKEEISEQMHKTHHNNNSNKWVAIIDTDEYIVPNFHPNVSSHHSIQKKKSTILDMITHKKNQHLNYYHTSPCFPLHRRQFSAWEEEDDLPHQEQMKNIITATNNSHHHNGIGSKLLQQLDENETRTTTATTATATAINDIDLMTLRYIWPIQRKKSLPGKAIIDVSRLNMTDFREGNHNPHRPVRDHCKTAQRSYRKSPFVVHHYPGSLEQFLYRSSTDVRPTARTKTTFLEKVFTNISTISDDSATYWWDDFVHHVGVDWARTLLEGAGQVGQYPLASNTEITR